MAWAWAVLNVAPPRTRASLGDPRLLWAALGLIAVILVGVVVLVLLDRWRKGLAQCETPSANDQLSQFRLLYEQGQMSQEEFDRIRNLLNERIRQELGPPGGPPAKAAETPGAGPPAGAG